MFADQSKVTNIKPVFDIRDLDYFLACNKGVPSAVIEALDEALKNMKNDGTIQRVTASYRSRFIGRDWLKEIRPQ
jgi:ABC-type amino acid transport substrate-binding protein